jgi:hypothetical protein
MQRKLTINVPWLVAALALTGIAIVIWLAFPGTGNSRSAAPPPPGGPVVRYAANVWTGDPFETGDSDVVFWERKLPINNQEFKAIFITVTGTAQTDNGDVLELSCAVNGNDCDEFGNVPVQNTNGVTLPWNSFTQTWCVPLTQKSPRITLDFSSVPNNDTVFMEHVVVYVDAVRMDAACTSQGFIPTSLPE